MRKNTLLASVAALSLFGATTIASAQGMNQNSPKGAESPAATAPKGESTAPSTPPAAKPTQTQNNAPTAPSAKPGSTAQDQKAAPQQAQDKPAATEPKSATTPAADTKPSTTTGAAASGGTAAAAAPPAEKRGQIATAIKQEKIPATTNVNFNISVERAFRLLSPSTRSHPASWKFIQSGAAIRSSSLMAGTSSFVRKRTKSSTSSKAKFAYWIGTKAPAIAGAFCRPEIRRPLSEGFPHGHRSHPLYEGSRQRTRLAD